MKKLLVLTALLAISGSSFADSDNNRHPRSGGFVDGQPSAVTTVQQALKARDDTPVTLTGYIVSRIGNDDDEFIFRDNTGEIKLDVEDQAWKGQNVGPKDKITISGQVDTNGLRKSEIDVYDIQKH